MTCNKVTPHPLVSGGVCIGSFKPGLAASCSFTKQEICKEEKSLFGEPRQRTSYRTRRMPFGITSSCLQSVSNPEHRVVTTVCSVTRETGGWWKICRHPSSASCLRSFWVIQDPVLQAESARARPIIKGVCSCILAWIQVFSCSVEMCTTQLLLTFNRDCRKISSHRHPTKKHHCTVTASQCCRPAFKRKGHSGHAQKLWEWHEHLFSQSLLLVSSKFQVLFFVFYTKHFY